MKVSRGLEKAASPVHGDLIVFAPGSCGADQTTGHVAVVDVVNTNATVTFIEQNRAGRRSCANDTAACFLHAAANSGAAVDGGAVVPDSGSVTAPDATVRPDRPADNSRADGLGSGGVSTGGVTGTGGVLGTGGTSGSTAGTGGIAAGGARGLGGQSGTGGVTTTTGAGGDGGTASSGTQPSGTSNGGCSCRLGDGSAGPGLPIFFALIAGAALLSRARVCRGVPDGEPSSLPRTR
jgi:MYXO-CTERM domain-containing protein